MEKLIASVFEGHPSVVAMILVLVVQYYISEKYPATLYKLSLAFVAVCALCIIYGWGYNEGLNQIPYEARYVNIKLNGNEIKLSDLIAQKKKDLDIIFNLYLVSSVGLIFFPWLEKHRREPNK